MYSKVSWGSQQKIPWPLAKLLESLGSAPPSRGVEDGMKTGYGILERPAARRAMADQKAIAMSSGV